MYQPGRITTTLTETANKMKKRLVLFFQSKKQNPPEKDAKLDYIVDRGTKENITPDK